MCLGSVLFCASFQMVIPVMPDYLEKFGGAAYKGYHIALFAGMALISRPFSGILTDRIGRIPVMVFGALVCIFAGIGYLFAFAVGQLLIIRFLHGMSTGFTPTGNIAYTADLSPIDKRGLAMGIQGMSNNLGMAIGPFIGGFLYIKYGFNAVFASSILLAIMAFATFKGLPETAPQTQKFKLKLLKINLHDFYEPNVYGPFIICFVLSFGFGSFLTIAPDHSKLLNIQNLGLAFTLLTTSSILSRFLIAKLSDIYGRVWILRIAVTLMFLIMLMVSNVPTANLFFILIAFWGLCQGASSPTVFAWTTDIAKSKDQGKAYASVFIGLELGIILGGYFTGFIYQNSFANIPAVYYCNAIVFGLGALFLWIIKIDKLEYLKNSIAIEPSEI